jgi:hypothetical protein
LRFASGEAARRVLGVGRAAAVKIEIVVKAGSKQETVVFLSEGRFKVFVKERPFEGRANEAVCEVLAEYFQVPKSHVRILHGLKSKMKKVEILGKNGL